MATLNHRHFGTPGRRYPRARYSIVNKKASRELSFFFIVHKFTSDARECKSSGRGARRLAAGQ